MSVLTLRQRILRGGAYLALRQALGTVIAVAGVLVLTLLLGPAQYGLYAAAIGLYTTVQLISQLGIGVFLIRHPGEVDEELYDVSATFLLLASIGGAAVGVATLPLVHAFTGLDGLAPIAIAIYAGLPVAHLAQVPLARLERALDYRRSAICELSAQLTFVVVSLPLALRGHGAWAAVGGWWAQQLVNAVLLHFAARYRPRIRWKVALVRRAVRYGVSYTASTWIHQLRRLVNPLVVGRYLGAEAVAVVHLTTQIVTHLSFIAVATWRLSTAALARVQSDSARVVRGLSEGMQLQMVAVAPFLLLFAVLAPWMVPALLGERWEAVATVFPYVAVAYLCASIFNLHSSALYVLGRNWEMALYHTAHTALLTGTALVLVPRIGLVGYGFAEVATLGGFFLLHRFTARHVGTPDYAPVAILGLGVVSALFWRQLGPWSLAVLVPTLAIARPWRQAILLWTSVRAAVHER